MQKPQKSTCRCHGSDGLNPSIYCTVTPGSQTGECSSIPDSMQRCRNELRGWHMAITRYPPNSWLCLYSPALALSIQPVMSSRYLQCPDYQQQITKCHYCTALTAEMLRYSSCTACQYAGQPLLNCLCKKQAMSWHKAGTPGKVML